MSPAQQPAMPPMPKPDEDSKAFFRSVVPDGPDVVVRPMFGNLAAFVNGNMFTGLFGSELFVRLPDPGREAVEKAGGRPFEPMPGRRMSGYVLLPAAWREQPKRVREWMARSLDWAQQMPAKQPKPSKKRT